MMLHRTDNKDPNGLHGRLWFGVIIILVWSSSAGTSGAEHRSFNYVLTIHSLFLDTAVMSLFVPSGCCQIDSHFAALKRAWGGPAYYCEWGSVVPPQSSTKLVFLFCSELISALTELWCLHMHHLILFSHSAYGGGRRLVSHIYI